MTMTTPWGSVQGVDQVKEEGIVGRWFVTAGKDGGIHNQGRVNEMISDSGYYMCCAFSWMDGSPSGEFIISFDDIAKYFLFTGKTAEEHDEFCTRNEEKDIGRPAFDLRSGAAL